MDQAVLQQRIMAHVAAADAAFLARHPRAPALLRPYVPGELPIDLDTPYVLVSRVGDGCYVRVPVNDNLARDLSFLRPSSLSREERAA